MSEPHGPIKVNTNRQIALPKALTDRVRLEPGDSIYVMQSELEPSSLLVVPVERVAEWMRAGREASDGRTAGASSEEVESDG